MTDRLTKIDWIAHGLRTLELQGSAGLKVGPMSGALNVSRGSFYWHFRDIADFRGQLLQGWRERTTDAVIRYLETEAEPERLRTLLRQAFDAAPRVDRAIRSWAEQDPEAAAAVAAVDALRIDYIASLLVAAGVEPGRALARATFLYWAHLGQPLMMDGSQARLTMAAMDEIAVLFES